MLCKNLKQLKAEIQDMVDNALINEVADEVTNCMREHIQSDVYDAYEPKEYQRRGENGGLISIDNILSNVSENILIVQNVTKGKPTYRLGLQTKTSKNTYIDSVIETGEGYDVLGNWVARPFMRNTYEDLLATGRHIEALRKGLKSQGLEVR